MTTKFVSFVWFWFAHRNRYNDEEIMGICTKVPGNHSESWQYLASSDSLCRAPQEDVYMNL